MSLLFPLNKFHKLLWRFHCLLLTNKSRLCSNFATARKIFLISSWSKCQRSFSTVKKELFLSSRSFILENSNIFGWPGCFKKNLFDLSACEHSDSERPHCMYLKKIGTSQVGLIVAIFLVEVKNNFSAESKIFFIFSM